MRDSVAAVRARGCLSGRRGSQPVDAGGESRRCANARKGSSVAFPGNRPVSRIRVTAEIQANIPADVAAQLKPGDLVWASPGGPEILGYLTLEAGDLHRALRITSVDGPGSAAPAQGGQVSVAAEDLRLVLAHARTTGSLAVREAYDRLAPAVGAPFASHSGHAVPTADWAEGELPGRLGPEPTAELEP